MRIKREKLGQHEQMCYLSGLVRGLEIGTYRVKDLLQGKESIILKRMERDLKAAKDAETHAITIVIEGAI